MIPIRPLSRDELRALDRRAAEEFGLPVLVLMENAGRGAADWLRGRLAPADRVFIACGPGNNGGDGAVVARHLDAAGFSVTVAWLAARDSLSEAAAVQRRILDASGIEQHEFSGGDLDRTAFAALLNASDWLVDALLGTGLTRPVEGRTRAAIEAINDSGKPVVSLDVPSGLDADTGLPLGAAVRARVTLTFAAPKRGFATPGSREFTGDVHVLEIGVPGRLLRESAAGAAT